MFNEFMLFVFNLINCSKDFCDTHQFSLLHLSRIAHYIECLSLIILSNKVQGRKFAFIFFLSLNCFSSNKRWILHVSWSDQRALYPNNLNISSRKRSVLSPIGGVTRNFLFNFEEWAGCQLFIRMLFWIALHKTSCSSSSNKFLLSKFALTFKYPLKIVITVHQTVL